MPTDVFIVTKENQGRPSRNGESNPMILLWNIVQTNFYALDFHFVFVALLFRHPGSRTAMETHSQRNSILMTVFDILSNERVNPE